MKKRERASVHALLDNCAHSVTRGSSSHSHASLGLFIPSLRPGARIMSSSPKFSLVRYLVATIRKITEKATVGPGFLGAEDLDLNPKPITSPLTVYAMESQNHLPVKAVSSE